MDAPPAGGDGDDVEVAVDALALSGGAADAGAVVPDGCRPAQPPRSTATAAAASSAAAGRPVGVGMMRIGGWTVPRTLAFLVGTLSTTLYRLT
jgi:hypothetical protein